MSMPQGYDYEFVDKLPDDCICKICLLVLRQPVQIRGCGHRFCKDCLYEATKSKEVCPVDLKRIKIQKGWWPLKPGEDVFDDIAVERTIKSLHIKCPSKSGECQWQGELGDVKIHEQTCDHLIIKCSKDHCDVMKPRMEMTNHLEHECEWREVLCPHCRKRQVFCKLEHHIKVCEEVKVSCPNACGKEMIRSEAKQHVSNDCPMTIIPCMYRSSGCTFKTERKNMDRHLEKNSKEHLALVKEENRSVADGFSSKISMMHVIITIIISTLVFMHYQLSSLKEKDVLIQDENQKVKEKLMKMQDKNQKSKAKFMKMQDEIQKLKEKFMKMQDENQKLKEQLMKMQDKNQKSKAKFMKMQDKIQKLKEKSMKMQDENQKLKEELIKIQEQVIPHTNKFIWRINNFSEILKKATNKGDVRYSDPFYTKKYGYKVRVLLYPNGDRDEANGHLSIYVHVMQGEYDPILPWPFEAKVTISLFDKIDYYLQGKERKTYSHKFSRPLGVVAGEGFGYQQLVSHKKMMDERYIVEDILYVQVEIEEY